MSKSSQIDTYPVWEILSYAWTEIGIETDECKTLLDKGQITPSDFHQVDLIIFKDICASFAVDTFLIFPLMLWMIMPDWGHSESYLRDRMNKWYAKPYWTHFLNPLRLLGYPLAVFMALSYRSKLRKASVALAEGVK